MLRTWVVGLLIGYGIVAAISMVILGWPESTPGQTALLELAGVPLQAALALGLWQLSRRIRPPGSRGRLALVIAAGLAGLGLLLVGFAYLTGPRGMVHPGLALVWIGLLAAMLVVVTHLPRRPVRANTFTPLEDQFDEVWDDAAEPVAPDEPPAPEAVDTPAGPRWSAPVAAPDDGSVESRRD